MPPAPSPTSIICQTCFRPLKHEYMVMCTKCRGFIQCIQCFNEGVEKGTHIRDHPYVVLEPDMPELFSKGWTSVDEIKLIDAIQQLGIGNWADISKELVNRTPEECENHYFATFFKTKNPPKPEICLKEDPPTPSPWPKELTKPVSSYPSDGSRVNMLALGHDEKVTPAEYSGYMPKRGEFEVEFLDNAEDIVCGIKFEDNPDQSVQPSLQQIKSFEQKVQCLLAYNDIVEERQYRTKIVVDHGLLRGPYSGFFPARAQESDQTFASLAPFVSHEKLAKAAQLIMKRENLVSYIKIHEFWNSIGIKDEQLGNAFETLSLILRHDGAIKERFQNQWNNKVKTMMENDETNKEVDKLLNEGESKLIKRLELDARTYLSLKDLIIREYSIKGKLSLDDAIKMAPQFEKEIRQCYSYFLEVGWIL